jgi:hypothetical protein
MSMQSSPAIGRASQRRYRAVSRRALAAGVLCLCAALFCARAAAIGYVDGISDQHFESWGGLSSAVGFDTPLPSSFADAWAGSPPAGIALARYVVQWDVLRGVGYPEELANLQSWYEHTLELQLTPELALVNYDCGGCRAPDSTATYTRELEALHRAFPAIAIYEAWNEPNHAGSFHLPPAAAAHFMNSALSFCATHSCTAVAGDFLDSEANLVPYETQYEQSLDPRDPGNWGIHPYANVKYEGAVHTVERFKSRLPSPATDGIWFTEVGAYYCQSGELRGPELQAANARYLVEHLIAEFQPVHVFYYQAAWPTAESPPCDAQTLDTALYAAQSANGIVLARPAASVVFGAR